MSRAASAIAKRTHLDLFAMAVLLVCCASWGFQQVAIKVALPAVPPLWQAGIRSLVAVLLLAGWMRWRGEPLRVADGTRGWGIAAGLLFSLEFLLIYWGLQYTSASRAVIFIYLSPFVVALGAWALIPGERLRPLQVVGLVCAFAGVASVFGESLALPDRRTLLGDLIEVAAAVAWGATTVLIKATPLARVSPARVLLYQLGVSALLLPVGALMLGELPKAEFAPLVVGSLLYQSAWIAFATYLAWFWLIQHYPAPRVASFTFLTPLFGVAFGGWLLDEPLTPALLVAVVGVTFGIWLVNRAAPASPPRAPRRPPASPARRP